MNELVFLKKDDIFTDSLVIAEGTRNGHRAVRRLIEKYKNDLKDFGKVCISNAPLETRQKKGIKKSTKTARSDLIDSKRLLI